MPSREFPGPDETISSKIRVVDFFKNREMMLSEKALFSKKHQGEPAN
jgi:hypothetical protein